MPEPATMPESQIPRRNFGARIRQWRLRAETPANKRPASKPKKNLTASLREWHKRIGLFAFIFMGWLGFSGVLINQSPSWGYDTKEIGWGWLMALYSLHPEPPQSGLTVDGHWFSMAPKAALLDGKAVPLTEVVDNPIGFAVGGDAKQPLWFIANSEKVILLTMQGTKFDELAGSTLPIESVAKIGNVAGAERQVVLTDGEKFLVSSDGLAWTPMAEGTDVHWAEVAALPAAEVTKAMPYSRPSVTLEHILVDAHSGHLFGNIGVWIINFVGIAALGLSITGVWMMWRVSRARKASGR